MLSEPERVLVDVSGVGYEVFVSPLTRESLEDGDDVTLLVHTQMSDSQIRLFGFVTRSEKALFERLISVSGVGPKTALGVMSGMPAAELAATIVRADTKALSKLPGIGKKTAERIVVELKDRLAKVQSMGVESAPAAAGLTPGESEEDAIAALMHLGYRRSEAVQAVGRALEKNAELADDPSNLVRGALRTLAKV